jgi:hypothetical protein
VVQGVQLVGAVLILVAFALAQFHRVNQAAYGYLVPNFVGAVLLGVIAVIEEQWGFVLLEVVWGLVSLWSIVMKATGRAPSAPA